MLVGMSTLRLLIMSPGAHLSSHEREADKVLVHLNVTQMLSLA